MTIKQAREAARDWMIKEATGIPGFCAAYTAGSTNWLPDSADLTPVSDLDIMVVLADQNQDGMRRKLVYNGALLEISYLWKGRFQSPEHVLSDYHLAPSLRTTKIILDPFGYLMPVQAVVCRDYTRQRYVRQRCANAGDKILASVRSINEQAALPDQVIACLFAAGMTTHVLLAAGLRNPTIRTRYVAASDLLTDYGHSEFQEVLLKLLGSARISRERASRHLTALTEIFDVAARVIKTPFTFASDISESARVIAIDGSLGLIQRGFHREAMFWIGITYSRCLKVLSSDAPDHLTRKLQDRYEELIGDLSLSTATEVRRRCADTEQMLPQVWDLAEIIIARNHEIESD